MMEWWNDMRMLCARYLVASEQIERTGPVEHAVRSAGYDDASEEGSSIEEEEEVDESYRETAGATRLSAYDYDKRYSNVGSLVSRCPLTHFTADLSFNLRKKVNLHMLSTASYSLFPPIAPSPFPHTIYDSLPAPVVQDTIPPQTTVASYEPPTHSPKVVQSTGYVPDELGLETGYADNTVPGFEHTSASSLPVHVPDPSGLGLRACGPRGSPRHTYPVASGSVGPQPGAVASPRASSPRAGVASPAYAAGTTAAQYSTIDAGGYGKNAPPVFREQDTIAAEPVTTLYTGDSYATHV